MTEELTKLIDKIVHEKTFSLDGVKAIDLLREKVESLEESHKRLFKKGRTDREEINKYVLKCGDLQRTVDDYSTREEKLEKRELAIWSLETTVKVQEARASTYKECVELIFRNTSLRREMYGNTPVPTDPNGYVSSGTISETVTETKE